MCKYDSRSYKDFVNTNLSQMIHHDLLNWKIFLEEFFNFLNFAVWSNYKGVNTFLVTIAIF